MAQLRAEPEIVHYVYYHDPNEKEGPNAGILCYWVSRKGTYLTKHGTQLPRKLPTPKTVSTVIPGNYEHFKGGYYYVVDCLELLGSGEFYVVYFSQKPGEGVKWYYRLADEFCEQVKVGSKKLRFRKI